MRAPDIGGTCRSATAASCYATSQPPSRGPAGDAPAPAAPLPPRLPRPAAYAARLVRPRLRALVYALGNRGAEVLETEGELRRGGVRWDTKNRNISRVFLHHTLAVAEVMVAFEAACRSREGVQLIPPEEVLAGAPAETRRLRLPFRWQVEVRHGGKLHRLGVEPDRVFGLRFKDAPENRRHAFFFLDADRGTMPVRREGLAQTSFLRKLICYQETWRQGIHRKHLGIPNFRVLTVTTSRERVGHLVEACRILNGGARLFLFTDQDSLSRGDILTAEWVNGRGEAVRMVTES